MRIITGADRQLKNEPSFPKKRVKIPVRALQERMARQAAIERSLARYLRLACGHMSTLETDLFYSHMRPKRGQTWCECCHDWVDILPPPRSQIIPDEPMF